MSAPVELPSLRGLKDPVNYKSLSYALIAERTPEKLLERAKELFPGWIIRDAEQFAYECRKLNHEWAGNCKFFNMKPLRVLLVSKLFPGDRKKHNSRHKLLGTLCDCLTRVGYFIREEQEFIECIDCQDLTISQTEATKFKLPFDGRCCHCRKKFRTAKEKAAAEALQKAAEAPKEIDSSEKPVEEEKKSTPSVIIGVATPVITMKPF